MHLSNAKKPRGQFLLVGEILLRLNEMSAMASDRQFKLARQAYSGLLQHFSFTESLILAQDERWRRA